VKNAKYSFMENFKKTILWILSIGVFGLAAAWIRFITVMIDPSGNDLGGRGFLFLALLLSYAATYGAGRSSVKREIKERELLEPQELVHELRGKLREFESRAAAREAFLKSLEPHPPRVEHSEFGDPP
jgi:hypothetical protein